MQLRSQQRLGATMRASSSRRPFAAPISARATPRQGATQKQSTQKQSPQKQSTQKQQPTGKGATVARGPAAGSTVRGGRAAGGTRGSSPAPGGSSGGRRGSRDASPAAAPPARRSDAGQFYFNLTGFPFPLGPFFQRKTVRREIERGVMWVFEQTQALELFNVYTPVRMTVIKLASGGLWVHAPVAPTDECVRLLKELDAPVEYIVLPTFAYEHKVFVGPFSRRFPKAQVYVAPYQWSFPLNLPPQFFGIFPAGELTTGDPDVPWADEIEQKLFLPPSIGVGNYVRFSEVAFFHKKTRTLLVTDAVVYIPEDPPECIPVDALLEIARDGWLARFISGGRSAKEVAEIAQPEPVEDTPAARRKA
ncbi:hypothetical protein GPECTOR_13g674 [Gonium pectorale]|uniref:DUF4336 domain-containing protein n=1 Tax=Gonium pectorale TaxID=33097 RepID=A0A150GMZ8_GONPE|nr:hypothetical protein GPECTOR_13g674 [Gonium pectorale]|eukprot:KXZ51187.1 hypothetical protein GPECTOR_13g674 [Gonium pectorale]